jgi:hypothetical protein
VGHAPTHRADGKPLNIRPEFRRQQVELLAADERSSVSWRFSYPAAPGANSRRLAIVLEPAAGGTRLSITVAWERDPQHRRRVLGLLLRPWHRFAVRMQLAQIGGGISRAFR